MVGPAFSSCLFKDSEQSLWSKDVVVPAVVGYGTSGVGSAIKDCNNSEAKSFTDAMVGTAFSSCLFKDSAQSLWSNDVVVPAAIGHHTSGVSSTINGCGNGSINFPLKHLKGEL